MVLAHVRGTRSCAASSIVQATVDGPGACAGDAMSQSGLGRGGWLGVVPTGRRSDPLGSSHRHCRGPDPPPLTHGGPGQVRSWRRDRRGAAPVIVSAGWCRIAGPLSWGVCRGVRTHVMVTDGSMAASGRSFPSWRVAARQARLGRTRPAKTGTPSVRLAWGLETPTGQWLGRLAGDSTFRGRSLRVRLAARRRARQ